MAKVILDADVEGISGKPSKKTATYCINKQTGKCYRMEYNADRKQSNTVKQQAVKSKFRTKVMAASTWWGQNKALIDKTTGEVTRAASEDMLKLLKSYKNQHRYGNPFSYLRSLAQDDGTITFPWSATATTPTTPTTTPDYDPETGV